MYHIHLYIGEGHRWPSQTKIIFGSNRNKPKQDLFRVCFGLFRETKKVSVCFGVSNLYQNNRNKQKCFVANRNTKIYYLSNCLGGSSVCFKTSKLSVAV